MVSRVLIFVLGLLCGVSYLLLGGGFLGWNAVNGYGKPLVRWALTMEAGGNPAAAFIYVHDAAVFFLLALFISVFAVFLIPPRRILVLTLGFLTATVWASFAFFDGPLSIALATTLVVVFLPIPAMLVARRLLGRKRVHAAQ